MTLRAVSKIITFRGLDTIALSRAIDLLADLFDRHMIDTKEFLRLVYSFAGEVFDETRSIPEGLLRPLSNRTKSPSSPLPSLKTDPDSGDVTEHP